LAAHQELGDSINLPVHLVDQVYELVNGGVIPVFLLSKSLAQGIPAKKHLAIEFTRPEQTDYAPFLLGAGKITVKGWTEYHDLIQFAVAPPIEPEDGNHCTCSDQGKISLVYARACRGNLVILEKAHDPVFELSFFPGRKLFVEEDFSGKDSF
jgi:hypothetical protein